MILKKKDGEMATECVSAHLTAAEQLDSMIRGIRTIKNEEIEIRYLQTLMSDDEFNTKRLWLYWPRHQLDAYGERYIPLDRFFTAADFEDAYLKLCQHVTKLKIPYKDEEKETL